MESPKRLLQRHQQRRQRTKIVAGALVAILVMLVIVIPCTLLLRESVGPARPAIVLLPLYIYPSFDAWEPLYNAIDANRDVSFTIILNPHSGPGSIESLENDFISPIQRLNAASNVQTIGYVRTGYAERDIQEVMSDIATYANWTHIGANLTVSGIFFDETPHYYSDHNQQYLARVNQAAKSASGMREPRTIIHNPGTIPNPGLAVPDTDVTVVLESSYDEFIRHESVLSSLPRRYSAYSIMVHSVPSGKNIGKVVRAMSQRAKYLFLTTADEEYYESFAGKWREFVKVMGA